MNKDQIDELCRLRSDLKTGLYAGSTAWYQARIDNFIKVLDEIIGQPNANSGDCISREQIRKSLNEAFGCENATKYGNQNAEQQKVSYSTLMLYEIADIVEDCCDNAQAVPLLSEQIAWEQGYEAGLAQGKSKQGEWKFDGWGTYCSECGYRPKIGCGKFCSECGAKMKGGAE